MQTTRINRASHCGFTFIEVMLVVIVVGLLAATISANLFGSRPLDSLKTESERFAGIINLAAEYALLNNVELGIVVEDNGYQIVGFDGVKWTELPKENIFRRFEIPAPIEIELTLDGLPAQENALISQVDMDNFGLGDDPKVDKKTLVIPQIFILSGGDITPFSMEFSLDEFSDELAFYRVDGAYTTPVVIAGPLTPNDR